VNQSSHGSGVKASKGTGPQRVKLDLKTLRPRMKLLYFRFLRFGLGLKIGASALKRSVLGLDEGRVLAEDRRRAARVDKFFEHVEQIDHGRFLR
jgi:hypothetical protein